MEVSELVARECIRDAIARYAHRGDTGRLDELLGLFAEDGTLEAGDQPPAQGRAAIRALFLDTGTRLAAAAARPFLRHHVSNVLIEVASTTSATALSYFFVITERGPDHWGRYRDRFVARDGRWLFTHRRAKVDGYAPGSAFLPR